MKDAFVLLSSYPFWVKAAAAVLLSLCMLLLLLRALARPGPREVAGPPPGPDPGTAPLPVAPAELAASFEARAERIQRELATHFKHANVGIYLDEFAQLHRLHVDALRRNDVGAAQDILTQIHALSRQLECREFWDRDAAERPSHPSDFREQLAQRAHRGKLIELYAGEAAVQHFGAGPAARAATGTFDPGRVYAHLAEQEGTGVR